MKRVLRLRKDSDFSKVMKYRKSTANKSFVAYVRPNGENDMRIGISVSKKLGNAVVRNKIKRQIREMSMSIFDGKLSNDYVIIARQGYLEYDFLENKRKLKHIYDKLTVTYTD